MHLRWLMSSVSVGSSWTRSPMPAREALTFSAACWETWRDRPVRRRSKYAGGLPSSGMVPPMALRAPERKTHTLVRIRGPQAFTAASESDLPGWAAGSLRRAPWVVLRRAPMRGELLPVGVRGEFRHQRFAAWLSPDEALELATPQRLASSRATRAVAALAALPHVERIMRE